MGRLLFASWIIVVGASGCAGSSDALSSSVLRSTSVEVPSQANAARVATVLAERDRRADDRSLDGPRQAAEVLAYLDVAPGMNVAVLAPGSGYLMELVARSVGLDGRVFARNPPSLLIASGLGPAWDERLARPAGARVIRIDDELGKPLAVNWLDLVFLGHEYAPLGARGVDSSAVNAVAWNALRPGGRFVVVDRADVAGETRQAVESHGFRFAGEGEFLRSGASPTDWGDAEARGGAAAAGEKRVFLTFTKP